MSSAVELLEALAGRGYRFAVCGDRLHVKPTPDASTVAELRANKPALLSVIGEHGGLWPIPLASVHPYVLWRGALADRDLSVCIACGVPPPLHGRGALDDPLVVDDVAAVPLMQARAVVAVTVARNIAELSPGRRLCKRCHRIGRVDLDGVCTFCRADVA